MIKIKIISYLLLPLVIFLGYKLYDGINEKVELDKAIQRSENIVKAKLKMIRSAQKAYLDKYGDYASEWEELERFVREDTIFNVEKVEIITPRKRNDPLYYTRTDSVRIEYDTIDFALAKEKLFPLEQYPTFDVENIRYVPNTNKKEFELFTAEVDKGGVTVDVIEVVDKYPLDKTRYDFKNGKPNKIPKRMFLRFGSRTEVTTAGNWE